MQISRIVSIAKTNFNMNINTSMLLLDLKKVFNSVWHDGLIFKLIENNVDSSLIQIFRSYLTNRRLKVNANGSFSKTDILNNGLPQGSSLSPTLFLLYINDIPKANNTELALFANDTAIIASSVNISNALGKIQQHLNLLIDYFHKWKKSINENKTKLIDFNKKTVRIQTTQ